MKDRSFYRLLIFSVKSERYYFLFPGPVLPPPIYNELTQQMVILLGVALIGTVATELI